MQLWRTVRQAALLRLFCVLLLCRSRRSLAFVAAPPRGVCAARTGQRAGAACLGGRRYGWMRLGMCADKAGSPPPASVPLYPLSALARNRDQQKLAVAREDYSAAARLRDERRELREQDEFTRLSLHLRDAAHEQRFEDAAGLRDALVASTAQRAADPPPLNRLLLLTIERGLATCNPDGSDFAELTERGSGERYAQPTWSPSGDMVAAVSYTGTALSSTVDAKHHIVVLQARDGEITLQEHVDFPPFLLQWAASGSSLSYLSRALRANTKLVALDVLPRPVSASMGRENGKRSGSTRDTVRSRVLKEGDLLFFSHLGVRSGGRAGGIGGNGVEPAAQLAVHSSVEGTVEVMGCEPRTPTNSSLLTQRSGLFSAPQWIAPSLLPQPPLAANDVSRVTGGAGAGYVLLAEEAMASEDAISAAQRERERQGALYTNNFIVRESVSWRLTPSPPPARWDKAATSLTCGGPIQVTYVARGTDMDAFSEELAREGDVLRVREEELRGEQGKMDDEHEEGWTGKTAGEGGGHRKPPAVEEMSQNISSEDPFWAGQWWRSSSSAGVRFPSPPPSQPKPMDKRSGNPVSGRERGGVAGDNDSLDRLGVVGQYSSAWKRLQAAGNQQLVVASLDDDGGAKVLGSLEGVSVSFGLRCTSVSVLRTGMLQWFTDLRVCGGSHVPCGPRPPTRSPTVCVFVLVPVPTGSAWRCKSACGRRRARRFGVNVSWF